MQKLHEKLRSIADEVEKAAQLLGGFSETELERPQIAAYYGVILAGSGDFPQAAKFS